MLNFGIILILANLGPQVYSDNVINNSTIPTSTITSNMSTTMSTMSTTMSTIVSKNISTNSSNEPCYEENTAYFGNNHKMGPENPQKTRLDCQQSCESHESCHYWTFHIQGLCYLKVKRENVTPNLTSYVSGSKFCRLPEWSPDTDISKKSSTKKPILKISVDQMGSVSDNESVISSTIESVDNKITVEKSSSNNKIPTINARFVP